VAPFELGGGVEGRRPVGDGRGPQAWHGGRSAWQVAAASGRSGPAAFHYARAVDAERIAALAAGALAGGYLVGSLPVAWIMVRHHVGRPAGIHPGPPGAGR